MLKPRPSLFVTGLMMLSVAFLSSCSTVPPAPPPAVSGPSQSLYARDWRYVTNPIPPVPGVALQAHITQTVVRHHATNWNVCVLSWDSVTLGVSTDEVVSFHATGLPSWTNYAPHSNNTFAFFAPTAGEPFQFQVIELATNGLAVGASTNFNFQVVTNFTRNGKLYIGQCYAIAGVPYLGWLAQPGFTDAIERIVSAVPVETVTVMSNTLEQWRIPDTNWYGLSRQ